MRFPARLLPWLLAGAIGALFAWDASRPPARQWTTRALVATIHVYQRTASPRLPALGIRCRFSPTCSHYAVAVLERHGILIGSARTLWRLARCGPWTAMGTSDPPS
jgi:putative membrane protein insertion efficiency factor